MTIAAPASQDARWRSMRRRDLAAVSDLAGRIHIDYPEQPQVFEEKLQLFPHGCFTLQGADTSVVGYCFSHPWTRGLPPSLDRLLGQLPLRPDTYFIHDLAVDQTFRGKGGAALLLPVIATVTRLYRLEHMTLIAVNKSEGFWRRAGFVATADPELQRAVRSKYSDEVIHMEMQIDTFF